jgi:type II secretory pathway predicted ATPase ExeA
MSQPISADLERPFSGPPHAGQYLPIGPIEDAYRKTRRMLERGETLAVVIGPPGTGKTLLGEKLRQEFASTHRVVGVGETPITRRGSLIRQILLHLGTGRKVATKTIQDQDDDALHLCLIEALGDGRRSAQPVLLLIDEAQILGPELLEEIRMLTNLIRGGRPLVQAVLLGGPGLDEKLADPSLESFVQRIAVRCYLHPLTYEEVADYVRLSLAATNWKVDEEALRAVHFASNGIPRLINHLMDAAIDIAHSRKLKRVDHASVQQAWAEAQQLPSPVMEAEVRPHGSEIEFGDLEETQPATEPRPIAVAIDHTPPTIDSVEGDAEPPWRPQADPSPGLSDPLVGLTMIDCFSSHFDDRLLSPEIERSRAEPPRPHSISQANDRPGPRLHTEDSSAEMRADRRMAPPDELLFGQGFDSDTPVSLEPPPHQRPILAKVEDLDCVEAENRLHSEIRRLSRDVNAARRGETATVPPSDDFAIAGDDRDLLVIDEEGVAVIEEPHAGFFASGGMRKPTREVDQSYQDLFSRLRGRR